MRCYHTAQSLFNAAYSCSGVARTHEDRAAPPTGPPNKRRRAGERETAGQLSKCGGTPRRSTSRTS
eukprot:COSAG06_NODE_6372_length_2961_cov_127.651992_2_plen_66_part_00